MATVKKLLLITVIALIAIEHDGVRYEEGDQFEIPADAVKPLADVNAIKVVGEVAEDTGSEATGETAEAPASKAKTSASAANA